MLAEKVQHSCVPFLVESNPVEARTVCADLRQILRQIGGAGWQEGKMSGIAHDMVIRRDRQCLIDRCDVVRPDLRYVVLAAKFRGPELDRYLYILQSVPIEQRT